jgi:hypothetical protein
MGSSRGFASLRHDRRPMQARFHYGCGWSALTEPCRSTRRIILQKARCHRGPEGPYGSNGMEAHDFRVYFTPLAGVLFTVPSRYCTLSVAACSLPWTVVSPASDQVLRARPYSGTPNGSVGGGYATLTRCGAAFQTASPTTGGSATARQRGPRCPTTPALQGLAPWHRAGLGSTRFVRHYYGCGSLFLRLLRCFSSPGAPRHWRYQS